MRTRDGISIDFARNRSARTAMAEPASNMVGSHRGGRPRYPMGAGPQAFFHCFSAELAPLSGEDCKRARSTRWFRTPGAPI